jgi:hypothetical protein
VITAGSLTRGAGTGRFWTDAVGARILIAGRCTFVVTGFTVVLTVVAVVLAVAGIAWRTVRDAATTVTVGTYRARIIARRADDCIAVTIVKRCRPVWGSETRPEGDHQIPNFKCSHGALLALSPVDRPKV